MKNPVAVVIRQPAPGLAPYENPIAKRGVKEPVSELKGIPAERNSIRTPAIPKAIHCVPTAERVEVAETGCVVVNPGVALRRCKRRLARLDAAGNPLVKVVGACGTLYRDRERVRRLHRQRLSLAERRRLVFAENGDMTLQHLNVAAIVIVIHAKIALAGRFHAEVAALTLK